MPPRKLENMSPEQVEEGIGKLTGWAQELIRQKDTYIGQLEDLTRTLHTQLQAAQQGTAGVTEIAGHAREELRQAESSGRPEPSVWVPAGITVPAGDYAPVRVVDGTANMEPVADVDQKFEIRFADFYQVRYGDHETTGGMRVLVIEGEGPIDIRPVSQTTVLICRGGTGSR